MVRQRVRTSHTTTTRRVKKSQTTSDRHGRVHCKTCGAFIGNRGRKK